MAMISTGRVCVQSPCCIAISLKLVDLAHYKLPGMAPNDMLQQLRMYRYHINIKIQDTRTCSIILQQKCRFEVHCSSQFVFKFYHSKYQKQSNLHPRHLQSRKDLFFARYTKIQSYQIRLDQTHSPRQSRIHHHK